MSPFASFVGVPLVIYLASPILVPSYSVCSKRSFSSHRKKLGLSKNYSDYSSNFVSRLLNIFDKGETNEFISNEDSQKRMESIIMDEFSELFSGNQNKYICAGINTEYLTPYLNKYIIGKDEVVILYIENLVNI